MLNRIVTVNAWMHFGLIMFNNYLWPVTDWDKKMSLAFLANPVLYIQSLSYMVILNTTMTGVVRCPY